MEAGTGWCVPTPQNYGRGCVMLCSWWLDMPGQPLLSGWAVSPAPWMGFRFLLVGRGPGRVCLKVQEGK